MQLDLNIPDVLGKVIQDSRRDQNISAEQMLDALGGASPHHYSNIENGRAKPGYKALITIVRFLHIDPNSFFYPERKNLDPKRLQLIHTIETCSDERVNILAAILNGMPPEQNTENIE